MGEWKTSIQLIFIWNMLLSNCQIPPILLQALSAQDRNLYIEAKRGLEANQQHILKLFNHLLRFQLESGWEAKQMQWQVEQVLKEVFKIKNMHEIKVKGEWTHECFWKKKQDSQLTTEFAKDIITRDINKVEKIDCRKTDLISALGSTNADFIFRTSTKQSVFFIEFDCTQTIYDKQPNERELKVIGGIFKICAAKDRIEFNNGWKQLLKYYTFHQIDMAGRQIKLMVPDSHFEVTKMSVKVSENATLQYFINGLIMNLWKYNQCYQSILQTMGSIQYPNKYILYLDGRLVGLNGLRELDPQSLEYLRLNYKQITLESILQMYKIKAKNVDQIDKIASLYEGHYTTGRFIVKVNRIMKSVAVVIHEEKQLFDEEIIGSNLRMTITNEFMPHKNYSSGSNRNIKTRTEKGTKKNSKQYPMVFLSECQLHLQHIDYESEEFNILEHSVDVVGSLTYQIISKKFSDLPLNQQKLQKFIQKSTYYYQKNGNPFHNIYHGFSVMHAAYMISKCRRFQQSFDNYTTFTFLISALCHDLNHTGHTNAFEEKSESEIANTYGDRSILENYSISKALKMFTNQQTNFIEAFSDKHYKEFRKLLVSAILATDNQNHLHVMSEFNKYVKDESQIADNKHTEVVIGGLLHGCDFWGNVKPFKQSYLWTQRVNQEFSTQYEKEVELKLEVTPYFKNLAVQQVMANNEIYFISAIVQPLYKSINVWTDGYLKKVLVNIQSNVDTWREVAEGEQIIKFLQ